MENSKRSKAVDRLSDLPDSLIFNILGLLQMSDVVKTTILSNRWKNLWTTAPNLNFDNWLTNYDTDKFRNFVNRVLLRWRGTRAQKFKFSFADLDKSLFADVDLWLRFAIDYGVEDLCIVFLSPTWFPQCVYSCSSLKKLCLKWCCLKINGNVEWNQLKSLTIVECLGVTQYVIDRILGGSPLLEDFTLSLVQVPENLNLSFRSTTLKVLSICKSLRCYKNHGSAENTKLGIWTPNLETLAISGAAYSKYRLLNVSPLWNVKFLKLNATFEEHRDIVRLLEISPNIKTLVLQDNKVGTKSNLEFKSHDPSKPFLAELRTIEVTWTEHDFSIFPLIEFLLKYASNLEKMVFRAKGITPPSNSLFLASQKLLRMQRSYPNAELIFCEY